MLSRYDQLISMIDEIPLSKSLPKILRVSQELGDSEFEKWIRLELHGYWNTNPALTEDDVVPEYRTVSGYYTDDYGRPLVISDPDLGFVNQIRLRFGVVELEGMIGTMGRLAFRPLEFTELIREHLNMEVTTFNFSPKTIPPVLQAIRTRLSDHVVDRKDSVLEIASGPTLANSDDILELKPNFYGIGLNLKVLLTLQRKIKFSKGSSHFRGLTKISSFFSSNS